VTESQTERENPVSKDEEALMRPITLEDEDFIKNIKGSTALPQSANFLVNT
jgi:hypothetical protein